ncbi:double-stranded RNA-binding protein 8-like isoform X2 [Corylus avellana]|uniref:double-stranded RNA-binding protein 8-like isoform X2 n=1 Tax=Corylus avellana TaxID=13451 RepID=UPI00286BD380|nr:double-stranded RNA-binding protein 8-like isoform X2 [Corylus avellana]
MGQPMVCAPAATATPAPSAAPGTKKVLHPKILEHLRYKKLLQQYTKRRCIPLPIYQTINEGSQGALQFRATILVDGVSYTSLYTISDREAAEWNVAKLALEGISQKIKDEGRRLICENKVPCKSTLNAFAVKMNLEMPTYNTIKQKRKRLLPFISSLVFNGVSYIGEAGRNEGEAEVLAARAVILYLLGSSDPGTLLF